SVFDDETGDYLEEFNISQNYPNPFNPSTKITYNIPQRSNVSLRIYDVLGKEIATLVNEQKEAGTYNIQFDASKLSSGVYIYSIQAGDFLESRKMILMK
nr:T9SS type A sorting domain-containing protein [Ignavibacterium sp.]